jgi:hypothetical protein
MELEFTKSRNCTSGGIIPSKGSIPCFGSCELMNTWLVHFVPQCSTVKKLKGKVEIEIANDDKRLKIILEKRPRYEYYVFRHQGF